MDMSVEIAASLNFSYELSSIFEPRMGSGFLRQENSIRRSPGPVKARASVSKATGLNHSAPAAGCFSEGSIMRMFQ